VSAGWFRSNGTRTKHIVHEGRCPAKGSAHPWDMVDGMSNADVLRKIGNVPWLRLCEKCADRLGVPAGDPARHSDSDVPA
jgi:hypothetical protein